MAEGEAPFVSSPSVHNTTRIFFHALFYKTKDLFSTFNDFFTNESGL